MAGEDFDFGLKAETLVGYALVKPSNHTPRPPQPSEPQVQTVPYKRPIAPTKRLPTPPTRYDVNWHQQNQEAIIGHLNDTLSSQTANHSVLLQSPDGKVFEVTIDDTGALKAKHRQG